MTTKEILDMQCALKNAESEIHALKDEVRIYDELFRKYLNFFGDITKLIEDMDSTAKPKSDPQLGFDFEKDLE